MTGATQGRDSRVLRVLLASLIDYAGLFPPASLTLPDAVAAYIGYLASDDAWALGRFVVPAGRLGELVALLQASTASPREPIRVSAVLATVADTQLVAAHNVNYGHLAAVDCLEMRAADVDAVAALAEHAPAGCHCYVELASASDLPRLLSAVGANGLAAKIRTGGVTADAFPSVDDVLRFMAACRDARVPFKATAGLHHAVRGEHPLTYAADAPCGTMFGFLNVVLAASALHAGADIENVRALLTERRIMLLEFDDERVRWGDAVIPLEVVGSSRTNFIRSVGSCSFSEPLDDLTSAGLR